MKIDINLIEKLAENISKYKLSEITVEGEEAKITLKKEEAVQTVTVASPALNVTSAPVAQENVEVQTAVIPEIIEEEYEVIASPMVGTYYGSPSPDSDAFVKEGDTIEIGDTLCIVEAMKLMNEVKSTVKGKIVKILVQDGQGIKKGDKLFLIK